MSDSELHTVHFSWPSTSHNSVIVTGTFDQWSSSLHLVKDETGFHGSTSIPWDTKILYKYVVDSDWVCSDAPTETDASGHTNNVYTSPQKPEPVNDVTPNGKAKEASAGPTVVDLVDTIVAREGTSTALGYVTSALGAAIQTQIGVDPINSEKIPVETPKEEVASEPTPEVVPAPETTAPVAPDVPLPIVPVNSEETNPKAPAETEPPSTHTPLPAPPAPESTAASAPASSPTPETTTKPTPTSATPPTETQHTFPSTDGGDSAASSTTSSPSKYGTVGSRKNRKSIFRRFTGIFHSEKGEKEGSK